MITMTIKFPDEVDKAEQQRIATAVRRTIKYMVESDFEVPADVDFKLE